MEEAKKINWNDFKSPYFSPEKGEQYELVLANWRQETRSFDEEKTEKPVIVFDVLKINGEEFTLGKRIFTTGAQSFAAEAEPIIEAAEKRGNLAIHVMMKYSKEKRYSLMDLFREPVTGYPGLKPPSEEAK